jgi:hypothetical protein
MAAPLSADAQLFPYNPYADTQFDTPEEAAAAAKRWPPFFKSPPVDAKHQFYYMMGWCKPKPWHYKFKPEDLVDVQKLPEGTFNGQVTQVGAGLVAGEDAQGARAYIMIHPHAEVTRVHVRGKALAAGLKPGMFVRLQGTPDEQGRLTEPLARLSVITPAADFRFEPATPAKSQTLVGKITGVRANQVTFTLPVGKVRRITAELTESPEIEIDATDCGLASAGDTAVVKGRVYKSEENGLVQWFASDVDIKLAEPLGKKPAR